MKKTKLKPISKKRSAMLRLYKIASTKYLEEHANCEVCTCSNERLEIHHKARRDGLRLIDPKWFMAVCRYCHTWIEAHPKKSREMGFMVDKFVAGRDQ